MVRSGMSVDLHFLVDACGIHEMILRRLEAARQRLTVGRLDELDERAGEVGLLEYPEPAVGFGVQRLTRRPSLEIALPISQRNDRALQRQCAWHLTNPLRGTAQCRASRGPGTDPRRRRR